MNKLRNIVINLIQNVAIKRKPSFLVLSFQFLYRDNY